MDPIEIEKDIFLSEISADDRDHYVALLQDREIYDNTLAIPFPYTGRDADEWIAKVQRWKRESENPNFAVRNAKGELMGGAGYHGLKIGRDHAAEIGYWLGKRFWGKGVATKVVGKLVEMGFEDYGLVRITARVFVDNVASEKVLIKNGFVLEGQMKKFYFKAGNYIDAKLYANVK